MKTSRPYKAVLAALSAFLCVSAAPLHAAVVATYNFTGGVTTSSDVEALTTASGITSGSGVTPGYISNRVEIGGDDTPFVPPEEDSLNTAMTHAIAEDQYLTFTLTLGSDAEIDLTSINFDYSSLDGYDFGFAVFSDRTGFTVGDQLDGVFVNNNGSPTLSGPIDLSGIASLQNLSNTSVEFRFYVADRSGATTRIHYIDSVSLEGNVTAVPEPTAILLCGLGSLVLLRRRR